MNCPNCGTELSPAACGPGAAVTLRCGTCGYEAWVHFDLVPPHDPRIGESHIRWRTVPPSADELKRFRDVDPEARGAPLSELRAKLSGALFTVGRFPFPVAVELGERYRAAGLDVRLEEVGEDGLPR